MTTDPLDNLIATSLANGLNLEPIDPALCRPATPLDRMTHTTTHHVYGRIAYCLADPDQPLTNPDGTPTREPVKIFYMTLSRLGGDKTTGPFAGFLCGTTDGATSLSQ